MIVAAGLGTRTRPLSDLRPKPALPVRGIPLIAYNLALLAHHGVTEVVINAHHLPELLIAAAERYAPSGMTLHFSVERELLDTGGGIRRVADFLRECDPCLIIGGDMILDASLSALIDTHKTRGDAVTMLLRDDPRDARFGSIGVDTAGRLRRIGSRFDFGGEAARGVYTWVNVVAARALATLPDRERFGHLDHWIGPLLAAGASDIRGEIAAPDASVWEPVGTLPEYLQANLHPPSLAYFDPDKRALREGAKFMADLVIGAGATLATGASLRRAVVWDGEHVGPEVHASDGVFAGGSFVCCLDDDPRASRSSE